MLMEWVLYHRLISYQDGKIVSYLAHASRSRPHVERSLDQEAGSPKQLPQSRVVGERRLMKHAGSLFGRCVGWLINRVMTTPIQTSPSHFQTVMIMASNCDH